VLDEITRLAANASFILQHQRSFVRKSGSRRPNIDLNECINKVIDLLEASVDMELVVLRRDLDESLPPVEGVQIQIEQVLMNLIRNAIDALSASGPGVVIVKTRSRPDNKVEIVIIDTGPGMKPELLARIFDPFFTTKETGLGMGLPVSRSIVEAHDGCLWAQAGEETGMEFHFTLPLRQPDSQ
jgi:C4-dicarboxylate-specific signal transduction histidine kinase